MPIFLVRARRETKFYEYAEFTVDSKDRDDALREVYRRLDQGDGNWIEDGTRITERGYVPSGGLEDLADGDEDVGEQ